MSEIRQLEEKYRDLIENSPEMIHQVNESGQFVHVNQTELDKLGYSLDEMLRMHLWDIVPPEHKSELLTYLEGLVSQGRSMIETVFLTRAGHRIDVEIHSTALVDPRTGGLIYSRAFVRDITRRKLLEAKVQRYTTQLEQDVSLRTEELSASQKRYKALFDFVADSVFMVDATACVVGVNQREEQALGHPETEVLGRSFVELVAPRFREVMQELFKKVFQGESRVPTQEIEVYRRSGALAVVDMDLIPIEGSTELLVMVQLRDISERKQLEQQLAEYREGLEHKVQARTREIEETKQYLENLLENANDVIYTLDPDQCFTYVNTKVETWGYRKDELIGRSFLSLLSKRYRSRWLKSSLDLSAKQVHEVEILSQDGDLRSVTVSVSPLSSPEGNVLGVLGIARDMTETKQLEQRIRNSEKLASVGKLAAGVAHEINNPLGGILNCLYNLRKGTLTPEREEEYVASMEDGLHRVQKIVRQLLDFSQQHAPELSLTNIHTVVDRVLLLTNHAIVAKGIRLEKQLASTVPSLMVDQHMIEQVLTNLVLNAMQAIDGEGVITIRTRRVEDMLALEVEDTGSGIPASVLPHIFDPFFSTKEPGEGTGLGLSVSVGIIERHGGYILVDSVVGRGTVFTVCLPIVSDRETVGRSL